jgi:hypothetical protein
MGLRIFLKALLICLILWGLGGGTVGAVTIDGFDAPDVGQSAAIPNGTPGSIFGSLESFSSPDFSFSIIRELVVEVQSIIPGGNFTQAEVNTFTTPSTYQLAQSVTVDSVGQIIYDQTLTGIPFNLSGFAGLRLAGVVNDFLTPFTLTLETIPQLGPSITSSATASILTGDIDFLFSSLVGSANLAEIDRITIQIDPPQGGDVRIDGLVTIDSIVVPPPATLILFGSGLLGLIGYGRKKFRI